MRVHLVSDVHLEMESYPHLPGGDLLILAGDTLVVDDLRGHNRLLQHYLAWFTGEVSKYDRVLVLVGNHECYKGTIEHTAEIYRHWLAEVAPHARLLDDEVEHIEGVAFVGSTLWSPYGGRHEGAARFLNANMNDCHWIRTYDVIDPESLGAVVTVTHGRPVCPDDLAARHRQHVTWLKSEIPKHEQVIVITHHAPSRRSGTKYGGPLGDKLLPAYCANLDAWIRTQRNIRIWAHGHTHTRRDYRIGETQVIANPHGYVKHGWGSGEDIARTFDATRGAFGLQQEEILSC